MQRLRFYILTAAFTALFAFPASAAATPSDADELDPDELEELLYADMELINDLETTAADETGIDFETAVLAYLEQIAGGDSVATASDAEPEEDQEDSPVLGEVNLFNSPVLLSLAGEENFINVLRFDVSVDGADYTLLFSPSYVDQIYVDSQDRLWNMGTSQIQGLVLDGDFNPYSTTGTLVYLAPCLGNNFSTNNNYGSPNWFREYYWSSSSGYDRLTYDDTYVQIQVTRIHYPFFFSDILTYILIFLVGGGVLICWLNRFRHY